MAAILNIVRKKCQLAGEVRSFCVLDTHVTFNKIETQYRCHTDALMDVALAQNEGKVSLILYTEDFTFHIFLLPLVMIIIV